MRAQGLTLTVRRLAYIAFFLETGLLLVVLPWSTFWTRNYFVIHWPVISPWLVNDFVRGGVTGIGAGQPCRGHRGHHPAAPRRSPRIRRRALSTEARNQKAALSAVARNQKAALSTVDRNQKADLSAEARRAKAVICLVTDRRLRPPVEQGGGSRPRRALTSSTFESASSTPPHWAELVTAVVGATRGSSTKVVVNNRVDVAVACGGRRRPLAERLDACGPRTVDDA